jgi:3',5'-cyclic AMP phosphodiesterase CpdA
MIPDAPERLGAFVDAMNREAPDFIVQMGDFCCPYDYNKPLLDVWNSFKGPRYSVIGNHDNDGPLTPEGRYGCEGICRQEEIAAFLNMPGPYYSFDAQGFHFVILNGTPPYPDGKCYPLRLGSEQRHWLEEDLDNTELPVILFCHEGIDIDPGFTDAVQSRFILERANERAGRQKVWLFLSAHYHSDYHNVINGINYVQINTMSLRFMGFDHPVDRYDDAAANYRYSNLKYHLPLKEPVWAVITLDSEGEVRIKGTRTAWDGPSPEELGVKMGRWETPFPAVPYVSDRVIKISGA